MLVDIICSVLIVVGSCFMLISAIGLVRFPDFYIRSSASTKASTMGLGLILAGIAIYRNDLQVFLEVFAIFFFILLISPLAAHVICRSAVKTKVPFFKDTDLTEIEDTDLQEPEEGSLHKTPK